jgi:hypothetical protein
VYLTDDAVDSCVGDSPLLARLIAAGMRVLVDVEACRVCGLAILDIIGKPATDEDLTTLLLTPGINAEWC